MPMPGKDKDSEDGSDRDRNLQADVKRLRSENANLMKENQRLSYEIYQVINAAQGLHLLYVLSCLRKKAQLGIMLLQDLSSSLSPLQVLNLKILASMRSTLWRRAKECWKPESIFAIC